MLKKIFYAQKLFWIEMNYWYTQQHNESQTLYPEWKKPDRKKKAYAVWFHFHKVLENTN